MSAAKQLTTDYLQQHNIQKILESAINKLCREKPQDPFAFLVRTKHNKQHNTYINTIEHISQKTKIDTSMQQTL